MHVETAKSATYIGTVGGNTELSIDGKHEKGMLERLLVYAAPGSADRMWVLQKCTRVDSASCPWLHKTWNLKNNSLDSLWPPCVSISILPADFLFTVLYEPPTFALKTCALQQTQILISRGLLSLSSNCAICKIQTHSEAVEYWHFGLTPSLRYQEWDSLPLSNTDLYLERVSKSMTEYIFVH